MKTEAVIQKEIMRLENDLKRYENNEEYEGQYNSTIEHLEVVIDTLIWTLLNE